MKERLKNFAGETNWKREKRGNTEKEKDKLSFFVHSQKLRAQSSEKQILPPRLSDAFHIHSVMGRDQLLTRMYNSEVGDGGIKVSGVDTMKGKSKNKFDT